MLFTGNKQQGKVVETSVDQTKLDHLSNFMQGVIATQGLLVWKQLVLHRESCPFSIFLFFRVLTSSDSISIGKVSNCQLVHMFFYFFSSNSSNSTGFLWSLALLEFFTLFLTPVSVNYNLTLHTQILKNWKKY